MPSKQKKPANNERYSNWLNTQLEPQQIRAFSAQCRISNWRNIDLDELKKQLAMNAAGQTIFHDIFPEVTSG